MADRLPGTQQENLLTLLCHSSEHGRVVADMVDPALFEGDYRLIAERVVEYWQRYSEPPGPHVADLLSEIFDNPGDRRAQTYRDIIFQMLRLSEGINARFAVDQLRTFIKVQRFRGLVLESARRLEAQRELALPEVEEMWADLLRARDETLERGLTLNDTARLVNYLQSRSGEFKTGIPELDSSGIVPVRTETMLLLASTGIGKTWALIHLAKRALMERKRVLYVSVELGEEVLGIRFWQAFFGVTKRQAKQPIIIPVLEKDSYGRLIGLDREEIAPEFSLDSEVLEDELAVRRELMEGKFRNLVIKRFPTRSLTVSGLDAYMDALAATGFEPDVLVLDYIGKMKTDAKDHRISLGRTFEDFYGLCVRRNLAGITAQQASKEGGRSRRTTQFNVAEDWSLIGTTDVAISISATNAEKRRGLARLYVEKGRNERDRFGVLITQNYPTGQFVIDSAPLDARYDDLFRDVQEDGEESRDDDVETD